MKSAKAIALTLLQTLKMFIFVDINLETNMQNDFSNLKHFQRGIFVVGFRHS